MSLRQVFTVSSFSFHEVWDRVQAKPIDAHVEPEPHHRPHLFSHNRIVIVKVRLMTEEAMPVILFRDGIPRPVGKLRIQKNNASASISVVRVTPNVPIPPRGIARTA